MPRVVSFIVLVAIVLLVAALFFQVMAQFILPLFLAGVLVVVFRPLHVWVMEKCGDRTRLAAGLTTLGILFIVLAPMCGLLWNSYREGMEVVHRFQDDTEAPARAWKAIESRASGVVKLFERVGVNRRNLGEAFDAGVAKLREFALPIAVGGMKYIFSTIVGLVIMLLAVYYFLADGPAMITTIMRLSPLDDKYELELLDKFGNISRTVVVATLLSAIVQGLLAGIGYYFAGVSSLFFLIGLTMMMAIVPFVGSAAVWIPVCAWLYIFGDADSAFTAADELGEPAGRPVAAIVLAVYCACVVSTSDNIIKPLVLHGQSNLHPLVALLSVLGGVQFLGPIGILVGPMVVAFLQALLDMFHTELQSLSGAVEDLKAETPNDAVKPIAAGPRTQVNETNTAAPPAKPAESRTNPKPTKRRSRRKKK